MSELYNPYIGIRPFRTDESKLFFGREKNIVELREKLECRFLSIVGTSGSGKSSLVRAGLIPQLSQEGWIVGTFRPQDDPINNLISTLTAEEVLGSYLPNDFVKNNKTSDSFRITDCYQTSGVKKPLVLVIDQFEEIFRFHSLDGSNKEVALRFVNLLIEAISQNELPIYVVITIRSDFLGRCSEFHGLTEWINKGQYLVSRLDRNQFERVILGFKDYKEYESIQFSQELISKLLNDIEDDPDQLPVLQHSLMRTFHEWKKSNDPQIDLKHYEAIGEMKASVSNHAEDIFKELKYQGLETETRTIFQRITEIDYNSHKVRNPTKLSTLIELNGGNEKNVIKIVDAFRAESRNFLRPDYKFELDPDTMVDVAHESLIRQWRTLGKWMREEAENAREYRLINQRRENQETEGFMLNPRLAISNYWWLAQNPTMEWASRYHMLDSDASRSDHKRIFSENEKFLQSSLEVQEKIDQANKTEQERKKDQQFQRITYLTVGLLIIALILGLFSRRNQILKDDAVESAQLAYIQAQQAETAKLDAESATQLALREKEIADSLREEASLKSKELTIANSVADNMKNQAIAEREVAESRSIDARIAEIGALLSESRAKANEIEANILKLTSEYKEKIEEAKKQALVSVILDDVDKQKANALESFEKFDSYNSMLLGLRGESNNTQTRSIEFYVKSIDSVRINLENIINRANSWIWEIDPKVSKNHRTFESGPDCDLEWKLAPSTNQILVHKLDSLERLKQSYDLTCTSVDEIRTEREWETSYPIENHRALLEAYVVTFQTRKEKIKFKDLSSFVEGSIEVNFEIEEAPTPFNPRFFAVKGIDQAAYDDGLGNIIVENGPNRLEINTNGNSVKYIELLGKQRIAISSTNSLNIFDYSETPISETLFESGEGIKKLGCTTENIFGLNESGELMIWNNYGKLEKKISQLSDNKITSFDCFKTNFLNRTMLAVGTDQGRVHIYTYDGSNFNDSGVQLNRLYTGGEPSVKKVKFSPNGHFLATSSSRQLDIWPLTAIDNRNNFIPIFNKIIVPQQILPIPMGRNESIQTSKGISGVSFDKNGDFLMYVNNSTIYIKPVNIYFMCQNLGSEYCSDSKLN